jgi:hypothetical protein
VTETGVLTARFRQGLVFVDVAVGSAPAASFLLDTGAGQTVVDARYASLAALPLGDPLVLRGGGGVREARRSQTVRLRPTGGPEGLVDPIVADLSPLARGMGQRLDGILGDDFLGRHGLELDYGARRAVLHGGGALAPPPAAVPLRFAHTPYVRARVTLGGRVAMAEFQIDTGSNSALNLWRSFSRAAFPSARGWPAPGLGVGGGTEGRRARIDLLEVAGQRIAGPVADLDDDARPDDAGPDYGGVIGGPAWAGRAIILDFPRQRFWVR